MERFSITVSLYRISFGILEPKINRIPSNGIEAHIEDKVNYLMRPYRVQVVNKKRRMLLIDKFLLWKYFFNSLEETLEILKFKLDSWQRFMKQANRGSAYNFVLIQIQK